MYKPRIDTVFCSKCGSMNNNTKCIHHPGKYRFDDDNNNYWTCCKEKDSEAKGCEMGDKHVWIKVTGNIKGNDKEGYVFDSIKI